MSTIELTALRVQPGDVDLEDALFRVQDLEGLPIDDSTWEWMLGLARMSVGGDASTDVDQDRRWGSVKVSSGSTLVDVLWQGNAVNLYYDVGLEPGRAAGGPRLLATGTTQPRKHTAVPLVERSLLAGLDHVEAVSTCACCEKQAWSRFTKKRNGGSTPSAHRRSPRSTTGWAGT
ncbi:MAG: hypothetical protein ACXVWU_13560 [Nocardioides sp.]